MSNLVRIDGCMLEGGGQILRNGLSLSVLMSRPVIVHSIRKGRSIPGLKSQHRTGIELISKMSTGSKVTGATDGSTEVSFISGRPTFDLSKNSELTFTADCGTAGSIALLLQISLPLLILFGRASQSQSSSDASSKICLILGGGTNASQAPQVDYTAHVLFPMLKKHFLDPVSSLELDIKRRGYYPKGGGEVVITATHTTTAIKLKPITLLNRGEVVRIRGVAHSFGLPEVICDGMIEGALQTLKGHKSLRRHDIEIEKDFKRSRSPKAGPGSGIVLWAELSGGGILGASAVGRKGINPAHVGTEAAENLLNTLENGGCVDEWMQDQMIIFMALADGRSEVVCGRQELTLHTKTAIWVAEQLTDAQFEVEKDSKERHVIRCNGVGYISE